MTSKIINMAERLKDEEDRLLDSMFASEPIADGGFTRRVVRRVRRKLLLRRLTLPIAALIGGIIAFKPVSGLLGVALQVVEQLPDEFVAAALGSLPTLQLIVSGGLILFAAILSLSMLED